MKDLKLYINEKLILKKTLSDPKIISLKKENEIVLINTFEIAGQYHDVDDSDAAIEREWDNFTRYTLDEIEKTYDYFLGVNLNDIEITKSNIQSNITNLIDYPIFYLKLEMLIKVCILLEKLGMNSIIQI